MDDLKQRLIEKVLTQVDPADLEEDPEGIDLGQRQAQMAMVKRLVLAFGTNLETEDVHLTPAQRNALLGDVVSEVMNYQRRVDITRTVDVQPTVERLVRRKTWNPAVVAYLRACIGAGRSVLVSGEEGAGKTTLLTVLASLAPDSRIVSVDESAPLEVDHPHVVHLRGEDPALFEWALRLSPDWLLIDEITPVNALAALGAMSAVPAMATLKGTSARSALGRLIDWALDAAEGLSEDLALWLVADHVDVVVNAKRLYAGTYRISEVLEVLPDPTSELGIDPVTLVALDGANRLAATGARSAFVADAFLGELPQVDTLIREPIPPLKAEPIVALPVEEAPPQEVARRGFLAGLFGGGQPKEAVSAAARGAAIAADIEMTDYEAVGSPPTVQKVTTYLSGDDLFDLSWAIEEGEEFLGEMGVGLAEIVDDGPPKRVAGFDVWMFDKETLETPSGYILSEGAYADDAVRTQYAGEVVAAAPGAQVVLDTGPLRLQVRVEDVELADDGRTFERLTLEFAAWGGATEVAAAPPVEAVQPSADVTLPVQPPAELIEEEVPTPATEARGLLGRLFGGRQPKEAVSAAARGAAIAAGTEMTDYEVVGTPPIVQKVTTYLAGDDLFDLSWAVEEGEEFLGEMGVGFAEVAEDGPPKRVAGFEVWMFDKETLETPSGVFLSEAAHADGDLRGKYEVRGDVVAATPGAAIVLDTGPLRVEVAVKDLELDAEGLVFERLTLEFAAWAGKET